MFPSPDTVRVRVTGSPISTDLRSISAAMLNVPTAPVNASGSPGGKGLTLRLIWLVGYWFTLEPMSPPLTETLVGSIFRSPARVGNRIVFTSVTV